jgi:hypothetical protein
MAKSKKPKLPIEGVDYELYGLPNDTETTVVRLIKGKFKGVTYYYTDIKIIEQEASARLGFDLVFLSGAFQDREALKANPIFIKQVGDILSEILYAGFTNKDKKVDVRVANSEQSSS